VRARALAAILAALLAGCGDPALERDRRGDLVYARGGEGPGRVTVVQRAGAEEPLPLVLFLHGWGATEPRFYAPWIEHLARAGNAVVYPRYQDSIAEPPPQVLGNVLVGMREAITGIDADLDSLVVVGHSAGGALASDYAAISRGVGLPVPRAVLSIYPGRAFRGIRFAIPAIDPARIPAGTRLHVLSGADDGVVDPRDARAIYDGADRARRRFEIVRTPGASDHLGPQRDTAVARRVFWRRLDALIAEARRSPLR
jgi:pimeloyl-ACP methyl ester carboxylesterase